MSKRIETCKDLRDLALFYCSKRETSRTKLGQYLKRKCYEALKTADEEQKETIQEWIISILDEFERLKVVDDSRYADLLVREYTRRGKGKRYIEQKLKERGVSVEFKNFEFVESDELARACEQAEKVLKKLSSKKLEPFKLKQKLLQKLVALGFSFDVAKKAWEAAQSMET